MRAPTALAALAAFAGVVLGAAPAAPVALAAPSEVFVEVNPATNETGEQVGIRASCPNNDESATVESDAFGEVTVEPRFGFLARSVKIPEKLDARSFTVKLTCPGGETATATLHVVKAAPASPTATRTPTTGPTKGPATGFGGTAGGGAGMAVVAIGLLIVAAGIAVGLVTLGRRRVAG